MTNPIPLSAPPVASAVKAKVQHPLTMYQEKIISEYPRDSATEKAYNKFSKIVLVLFGIISALVSVSLFYGQKLTVEYRTHGPNTAFDWQKIIPSPSLAWVECYADRQCARLEVPLDYADPKGDKAAVALLRVKAKVSPDSKEYRGPVLFNPGGPGGSGIVFINERGDRYQQILGDEYDIIGFDPRGIGETTPAVSIFSDSVERALWDAGAPPPLNSTVDALPQAFSRAQLSNELVEARSKRAAQHASTAVVARDMLSITKAHGRDRLQYWGFSYGTLLGATYAAMFPNNIERLIIDGVVDYDDYYSGSWSRNLIDTDKILQYFYDNCAIAGPACPLHANSSALIQQRLEDVFASIKASPMSAINGSDYANIDFRILKSQLFAALYKPFALLPPLAQALAALEDGDGRPALALWRMMQPLPKCNSPLPPVVTSKVEARLAVMCGEGPVDNSISNIARHFEDQSKISVFADVWTDSTRTSCAGWRIHPTERFAGPFAVNTSFPLLVIGNTADPVTPLVNAQKAAKTFGGSVLLTVNTPGHCSEAATSLCSKKIVRNYFRHGELPDEGTVCEIEDVLFGEPSTYSRGLTAEDAELLEVARSLSRDFQSFPGFRFL